MKPLAWLIIPQVLIGTLGSWYYGVRIGLGEYQEMHRGRAISMRWIDAVTLLVLVFSIVVIWRQVLARAVQRDGWSSIFRVALLSLLVTGLLLSGLIVWAFFFVPYVPNSFPPWSTGTTLAVTLDCLAFPGVLVAGLSFVAGVAYVFTRSVGGQQGAARNRRRACGLSGL
jgi:hypothetical protein